MISTNNNNINDLDQEEKKELAWYYNNLGRKWGNRAAFLIKESKKSKNQNNYELVEEWNKFANDAKEAFRLNKEIDQEIKERERIWKIQKKTIDQIPDILFYDNDEMEKIVNSKSLEEEEKNWCIHEDLEKIPEEWGIKEAPYLGSWVNGGDFGIFCNNKILWLGNIDNDVYHKFYDKLKFHFDPSSAIIIS